MIDIEKYPRTAIAWMRCEHVSQKYDKALTAFESAGKNLDRNDAVYFDTLAEIELRGLRNSYREAAKSEGYPLRNILSDEELPRKDKPGMRIANSGYGPPTLWLYGDIGEKFDGITAEQFQEMLSRIDDSADIDLHIHSAGGLVSDSFSIYTQLISRRGAVNVIVDGKACSGASIVAMAGTTVSMATGAWMMIHEGYADYSGRADDFEEAARRLRSVNQSLLDVYKTRWKGTDADLRAALAKETWFDARQTVAVGLADQIISQVAVAARVDDARYQYVNIPAELAISAMNNEDRNRFRGRRAEIYKHRYI